MVKKFLVIVAITLFVTTLAYCIYQDKAAHLRSSIDGVVADLKSEALTATYQAEANSGFLVGKRYWLTLANGEHLSVYIYESNESARKDAAYVDSGGCSYNKPGKSVHVSWAGMPHLFQADNLIVLYVGDDTTVLAALRNIYGEQFAGFNE